MEGTLGIPFFSCITRGRNSLCLVTWSPNQWRAALLPWGSLLSWTAWFPDCVFPQETSQRQGFSGVLFSFSLHLACPSLGLRLLACGRLMTTLNPAWPSLNSSSSVQPAAAPVSWWGRVQEPPSWYLLERQASSTTSLAPASSSSSPVVSLPQTSLDMDPFTILPIALPMYNCHHLSKGCLQQCSKYPPVFGLSSSFQTILNKGSVQFSCSVVSNSLQPHGLQHARPPCLSPTSGIYPNSCPLSWWRHPIISSSVVPFSCPQSFPASGSFQMSQLFASDGQSIGVSTRVIGLSSWNSIPSTSLPCFSFLCFFKVSCLCKCCRFAFF